MAETKVDRFLSKSYDKTVADIVDRDDDYMIQMTLPTGKDVKILVPKDLDEYVNNSLPIGLNLVFYGHYT